MPLNKKINRILILPAVMMMSSPVTSDTINNHSTAQLQSLDLWIDNMSDAGELSGAFLYAKGQEIIFEKAVGVLHPENSDEIQLTSSFNLASVSKHFTAIGVMVLHHQGKLKYDDSVETHIPRFPYSNVTIRHLLQHTSGLPDYMALVDQHWAGDLLTNEDMQNLFIDHAPELEFIPGEQFEYSNTGYVFLAALIEHVSDTSFERFMQENVLTPLALKDTAVFNRLSDPDSLQSRVFGQLAGELNDLNDLDGVTGDGAVYSSVRDLLAWHRALSNESLLPQFVLQEAFEPAILNDGTPSYYGFGWGLSQDNTHVMQHDGSWVGFNTYMARNTDTDELLVLLTNDSAGIGIGELLERFLEAVEFSF